MSNRWSRLFSTMRHSPTQPTEGPAPIHWIDTTPVESSDMPCTVQSLNVEARVAGLHAEVTQTIAIHNPNRRPLSVELVVPLPDRAVVCGYALEIDGHMRDGVVVEKEKARVAFETEQRRGADPGLVEAVRGNVYRTRVYPVPARGERRVRLRYVAPLLLASDGSAALDLPMPPEPLAKRSVQISVRMLDCPRPTVTGLGNALLEEAHGYWTAGVEEQDVMPSDHIRVAMPELPSSFAFLERDDEGDVWFCASATESHSDASEPVTIRSLTVLWDASGSREQADLTRELELLKAYCTAPTIEELHLVVFGERVRGVHSFKDANELVKHVRGLNYDGGTNLAALSQDAANMPFLHEGTTKGAACVMFTDGMDTLADKDFKLPDECDALAVVSGPARDAEALRRACKGRVFDIDVAPKDADELASVFARPASHGVLGVTGSGIADMCDIGSVGAGRHAVVGKLVQEQTQLSLEGAGSFTLKTADARPGSTLPVAWAARRVALLSGAAEQNADELLRLGRRFGVVSPETSLLVLETVYQWVRYELEPPTSWESMHEAWSRAKAGAMRLGPAHGNEQAHRRSLAREWQHILDWWNRDYNAPVERRGYCLFCGASIENEARFCPRCGHPQDESTMAPLLYPEGADGIPPVITPDSAPRTRPASAPSRMSRLREYRESESAPAQASMPLPRSASRLSMSAAHSARPSSYIASDATEVVDGAAADFSSLSPSPQTNSDAGARVRVRPWMPNMPYIKALDKAYARGTQHAHEAYYNQRANYRTAPSFFLDCAGWFMAHDDEDFAVQVVSNLAELRIEDAALLRVMGWRLREAGKLELALTALRRALQLRKEDAQGYRDVALVLDELARASFANGNEEAARAYAKEAGELYRKCALTPWRRHPISIGIFAIEEYNVFRAWADAQSWDSVPDLPSLGEDLEGVLECDLRITLAWDADETDVDIHVTEPSGEEAYYAHRNTQSGGRVSEDITDGYGPELYQTRVAQEGTYNIRAHYFASHQQAVFGPATCTLTVYTDWGRPQQHQHITTTRLSNQKEMVQVGTASYGDAPTNEDDAVASESSERQIRRGMQVDEVVHILGEPDERQTLENGDEAFLWSRTGGRQFVVVVSGGAVVRTLEQTSWGEQMIIEQ